ncbi:type I secretion system permease/ATPase [Kordiimonas sp. SCSIO 12603]|uniref:type I secretion system permease/ATPase n=1 Tax=Kordiimonas sp. SCSIO 12603 TaxID=2829596 RepID=UPI002103F8E3|nr:type I secretion system permease/ATPase [Kordiimonas sp. SCSIO 12603]UTW60046.1 type I secretion system permease/ATPase [Kordiimonas sp. SCSIO 12603]
MALIDDYREEEQEIRRSFKVISFYSIIAAICMLGMPIFMFQVYDRILRSGSIPTLMVMLAFAVFILVCYGYFDSVRQRLLAKSAVRLESKVAGFLFAGELSRESGANTQSIRDLMVIRQTLTSPAMSAVFDLPLLPLFTLLIFLIHWGLGFVVLAGAVIILAVGVFGDRATSHANMEYSKAAINSNSNMDNYMSSQELIRSQGLYREAVTDWGRVHGEALSRYVDSNNTLAKYSGATKAVRQIVQVLMIAAGALLVLLELASPGVIFASAMIGGRALQPIEAIVGSWRTLVAAVEARKRLMQRLEEMDLPVDRTPLPRPKGVIGLDRVMYVPRPGMQPVIKGIQGVIQAGDSVAIIGPSGAGKSTLARLIVGYLRPNSGVISLDGQDLHVWDPTARGMHIGYMPQQVTFFNATVRENIARLRKDDPPEMAIEAAKRAGVHEVLMKLPQGYDTVISPAQFMPSGGQSQLIALARTFYGNPAVLVLDEPNAALDKQGEEIFHKALAQAKKDKITTIVVTQRPNVLQHVDKVMLLQDGTVKDYGDKDKVMNSGNVTTQKAVQNPANKVVAASQKAGQQAPEKKPQPKPVIKTMKPVSKADAPAPAPKIELKMQPVEKPSTEEQPADPSTEKKGA